MEYAWPHDDLTPEPTRCGSADYGLFVGREPQRFSDYNRAADWMEVLNAGLDQLFERYDAILTPAATGEAPAGLDSTGDPVFCTLWTYCGTPALSLPLMTGPNGLPLGVQVVGRRGDDARLLRTANWLIGRLADMDPDRGTV